MVESGQGFNEDICTLVTELVSSGDEEVESFVQIKVIMTIKMAPNETVDLLFRLCMQILEFVESTELFNHQSVGSQDVGFPLQEVFWLDCRNLWNRGENVRRMCCCSLHAITVVNLAISRFFVNWNWKEQVINVIRNYWDQPYLNCCKNQHSLHKGICQEAWRGL